ncbi:hypothetical protein OnM2_003024 [Erysiphe neolycopersici]|uniref:Secreted protein n=1 Tax=Erysiphe neolycopersici TaxID=212602 RepID=A0A420I816_9PEZI|nr:hypothetical protein OnM2_003024 [Erysiphe neolycopersici]
MRAKEWQLLCLVFSILLCKADRIHGHESIKLRHSSKSTKIAIKARRIDCGLDTSAGLLWSAAFTALGQRDDSSSSSSERRPRTSVTTLNTTNNFKQYTCRIYGPKLGH